MVFARFVQFARFGERPIGLSWYFDKNIHRVLGTSSMLESRHTAPANSTGGGFW